MAKRGLFLVVAAALAWGCGGSKGGAGGLTILAASSMQEGLAHVARAFEREHAGKVSIQVGGSQELRAQLEHGAVADVFVSADRGHAQALADQGLAGQPVVVARNEPVLIVPRANPAGVKSLADLARPGVKVVLGASQVPIGRYSREILDKAGLKVSPASEELNVRQVLAKVALGEADAGIVYHTDAMSAIGRVTEIRLSAAENVTAEYFAVVLTKAPRKPTAEQFVAFLRSPAGRGALDELGFLPAP
jgi:molybdate transport system substrate-binding protein